MTELIVDGTGLAAHDALLTPVLAKVAAFRFSGVEVFLSFAPPLTITNPGLVI